ncbi:MAG: GIY-YIG nuclease family protein [Proteobacteria bacterium]|nr:GIY-YIG nuclease family protein [Pseudomonadota bacterium]
MKYYTYILHSKKLSKFYIGATSININTRIDRHLSEYYENSKFTAKANDWILFYCIECCSYTQALKIEKHIKKMKSKVYINNLLKFPEITEKLLKKFDS